MCEAKEPPVWVRMGSEGENRGRDIRVLVGYSREFGFYSKDSKEAFEGLT